MVIIIDAKNLVASYSFFLERKNSQEREVKYASINKGYLIKHPLLIDNEFTKIIYAIFPQLSIGYFGFYEFSQLY